MLTPSSAAALLSLVNTPKGPGNVLASLGFSHFVRLDRETARGIGVEEDIEVATIARRQSHLRALSVRLGGTRPLREYVAALLPRIAARAPEFAWFVLALRADGSEVALSTWSHVEGRVRRASLFFQPNAVRDSDAETVTALAAAAGGPDALVHMRWHEILGREAISTRFYRALEKSIISLGEGAAGSAPSEARRAMALTLASRLLFLSFLQSKGWLDGDADFLARHVDSAHGSARGIQRTVFSPLFFGTLNTRPSRRAARAKEFGRIPFLNGGLFAKTPLEARYPTLQFRDREIGDLFDQVLTRYRFSAHEERGDASEAAIDPEMLGRAFESLMASRDRRESGAFYTPHALVERTVQAALDDVLDARGFRHADSSPARDDDATQLSAFHAFRVIDPACGTGAFLVHMLDRLTDICAAGSVELRGNAKRRLLSHSIFGVDINPMAVWLCELRLWLSMVIELNVGDPMAVPPLPNLDRNIRVGDALDGGQWLLSADASVKLVRLRDRYARATGASKRTLARALDRLERAAALSALDQRLDNAKRERQALVVASRGRDLFGGRRGSLGAERARRQLLQATTRSLRVQRESILRGGALPFRFASHFADAMNAGGFDLVIGNPPWVRVHRIPPEKREAFKAQFRVFREAAWKSGAESAGAGVGFGAQVDLAALFAELGVTLVRPQGTVAMLLPMKLWRSLAGGGVRRLLHGENALKALEDWSEAPAAFDAAVYPSLLVVRRDKPSHTSDVGVTVHKKRLAISWRARHRDLAFDDTSGAPWIVLPPEARRAWARMQEAGTPLCQSFFGAPLLGVKCGLNDAFLVSADTLPNEDAVVSTVRGNCRLDRALLRPILRGEHVQRWRSATTREFIVWTHGRDGKPLTVLPPATSKWMTRWRQSLQARSDASPNAPWWSLYRTEGAANDRPRVVWADVSKGPRASVLPAGSPVIPLNTCYVARCRDDVDAATLVALLNSALVRAWLDAIAEPARGGYRRYLGWTMACLPLPHDWARARAVLAPLGAAGVSGNPASEADLFEAVCDAYGLGARGVAPLVEWESR